MNQLRVKIMDAVCALDEGGFFALLSNGIRLSQLIVQMQFVVKL
jgi:hypothetical protein